VNVKKKMHSWRAAAENFSGRDASRGRLSVAIDETGARGDAPGRRERS
jgi:hypothetical protein